MGLDMYLYKIDNLKKFKEYNKKIEELDDRRNKLIEDVSMTFDQLYKDLILKFGEDVKNIEKEENKKIILFNLDREGDIEKISQKFLNFVKNDLALSDKDNQYSKTKEAKNFITSMLFYYFPIFDTITCQNLSEKEEKKLKDKLIKLFIKYSEKIKKGLDQDFKNKLISLFNLNNEIEELGEKLSWQEKEVIYWRKSNQIHNWFHRNVEFEYKDIESKIFDGEVLLNLENDINRVLDLIKQEYGSTTDIYITEDDEIYNKIMEIMPPVAGFFFGSTDLNKTYIEDLEYTLEEIKKLNPKKEEKFYYYASY